MAVTRLFLFRADLTSKHYKDVCCLNCLSLFRSEDRRDFSGKVNTFCKILRTVEENRIWESSN